MENYKQNLSKKNLRDDPFISCPDWWAAANYHTWLLQFINKSCKQRSTKLIKSCAGCYSGVLWSRLSPGWLCDQSGIFHRVFHLATCLDNLAEPACYAYSCLNIFCYATVFRDIPLYSLICFGMQGCAWLFLVMLAYVGLCETIFGQDQIIP